MLCWCYFLEYHPSWTHPLSVFLWHAVRSIQTGLTVDVFVFSLFAGLPCLKWLSVARIYKVSDVGISALRNGTDSPVEHIDLSHTSVNDKPHSNVFRILSTFSKLCSLNLTSIKVWTRFHLLLFHLLLFRLLLFLLL